MQATENSKPDDYRFFQVGNGQKLSELEAKICQFAWINGKLFVPGIITGEPPVVVFLKAACDHVKAGIFEGNLLVPADWIEKEYPILKEVLQLVRNKAEQVRY